MLKGKHNNLIEKNVKYNITDLIELLHKIILALIIYVIRGIFDINKIQFHSQIWCH